MNLLTIILAAVTACSPGVSADIVPGGKAELRQLQPRDSILIADQLSYGFTIEGLREGTLIALPDFSKASNDTLTLVRDWQLDTLVHGKEQHSGNARAAAKLLRKPFSLRASIILSPFEEGVYRLPDIPVQRQEGDRTDTLLFEGMEMEVKTMPVDTATFVIHDIKGQIRYPVTFGEVWPWAAGSLLLIALCVAAVLLIRRAVARRRGDEAAAKDPAYIIALRELDKYRGDKYWAPEKQKQFYSGITDALKFYIDERFGVDAPEMTTAELFAALKSEPDITPQYWNELKELFERADFVKFAKFHATDEENAKALPLAVGFVTSTYQTQIEDENAGGGEEAAAQK